MEKTGKKSSPVPLYFAAGVWLLWGLLLPLYRPIHFLLAAMAAALVGLLVTILLPDKSGESAEAGAEEPAKAQEKTSTGNPEIDALITEGDKALAEMRRLNDSIPGEAISAQIDRLEADTRKIISHVAEHPEKLPQIRKFMSYYLPTTLKLLNAYDRMGEAGVAGENIDGTRGKVEAMMDTIVTAFDRQLDALFADEALDISTDITVMENLLKQEGLNEEKPFTVNG